MALFAALLISAGSTRADDEGMKNVVPRSREELEAKLTEVLRKTKTPGLGYALVTREGVEVAAGLGQADVATGRAATGDTLFRIGSISKMFVGLSALLLQEEGKLRLDDTFRSHAPEIAFENAWESTDPVRLVHLLEHTSGFDDLTLREYAHNRRLTAREGLDYEPRSRRSRWRPGTRFSYCNSGPPMVAYVIEKLTGQAFEDFVARRFFAPLGMRTATYFAPPPETAATLYHPDGRTPYPYWEILVRPSGSINASARELAELVVLLLGRGTYGGIAVLPASAIDRLEQATTTLAARAGLRAGYGLGNYTSFGGGFELHGHDGGVDGGLATLAYIPGEGVGFVAFINSGSGEALRDVSHLLRNHATRDRAKPQPAPSMKIAPETAADLPGWYVPDSPRQEDFRFLERLLGLARVRLEGESLVVSPLLGKARTYVATGSRAFRRDDQPAPSLVLLDTPEGRLLQDMSTRRKVPSVLALGQTAVAAAVLLSMASAPLFALVWVPRWAMGKLRGAPRLAARALPLLAVLSLGAAFGLFMISDGDLIGRFGNRTPWSMGFFALTIGFAVFSLWGAFEAFSLPRGAGNRWARAHSRWVAAANLVANSYLTYWGIVGLRTWV